MPHALAAIKLRWKTLSLPSLSFFQDPFKKLHWEYIYFTIRTNILPDVEFTNSVLDNRVMTGHITSDFLFAGLGNVHLYLIFLLALCGICTLYMPSKCFVDSALQLACHENPLPSSLLPSPQVSRISKQDQNSLQTNDN